MWEIISCGLVMLLGIAGIYLGKYLERNAEADATINAMQEDEREAAKIDTSIKLATDDDYNKRMSKWTKP